MHSILDYTDCQIEVLAYIYQYFIYTIINNYSILVYIFNLIMLIRANFVIE